MLLLTHADIFDQYTCANIPTLHGCPGMPGSTSATTYPGSASPFGHDISPESPTPSAAYSRNWTAMGLDPRLGDEFLLKRGSSGDWVRFVQLGPWCGWDQTRNCMEWVDRDTQHGFYTMGTVYDSSGREFSGGGASGRERFKYFNSCTKAGGCMRSGCDGIGFGVLESHLRATDGNGGFGGTWGPPCFRWNGDACDDGDQLPYTYWFRRGGGDITQSPRWMIPCTAGGGAIAAEGDNVILVQDSTFRGNRAEMGGAVHFKASEAGDYFTKPASRVLLLNVTASGNSAIFDGGAVSASGTSNNRQVFLEIYSSDIRANSGGANTEDRGGGISINKAFLTMANTTVSNNTADIGGGVSFRNANVEASNCVVSANVAITRRGFSAGMSIEDASNVVLSGVNFTDNVAIPSTGDPQQPGMDIYLGDGLLTCSSICAAGTYETNESAEGPRVGDCANAVYEDCDPTCYSVTTDPGRCTLCGPGTFNPVQGSLFASACLDCPPGTSSSQEGRSSPTCSSCEAGTFSTGGARECDLCPAGSHAPGIGSSACRDCPAGKFTLERGMYECSICAIGKYASAEGSSGCTDCPAGMTTITPLSTSNSSCVCESNSLMLASGACQPCDSEFVDCAGGADQATILTKPGYFLRETATDGGEYTELPEIFECLPASDCPGGLRPGECPEGHTGMVCAECVRGWSRSYGDCTDCEGISQRRFLLFLLGPIFFLCVLAVVLYVARKAYEVQASALNIVGNIGGIFITYLQLHYVLTALAVEWPDIIEFTVFEAAKAVVLNEQNLALDCELKPSAFLRFLPKLILFVGSIATMCVMWAIGQRIEAIRQEVSIDALMNGCGFLTTLAFVPLAVHTTSIMNCYMHPDGRYSMRSEPSVICYEGEWSEKLLPMGIIAFVLLVISTYVVFAYLTYSVPKWDSATTRLGFLIIRFRPDIYYWGMAILTRNLLLSLAPVFSPDNPFLVAVIIVSITSIYSGCAIAIKPWKFLGHTVFDCVTTGGLAITAICGVAFSDAPTYPYTDNQNTFAWNFLAVCIMLPILVSLGVMLYVFRRGCTMLGARDVDLQVLSKELVSTSLRLAPIFDAIEGDYDFTDDMKMLPRPSANSTKVTFEKNLENFSSHDIENICKACLLVKTISLGQAAVVRLPTVSSSTSSRRVKSKTTDLVEMYEASPSSDSLVHRPPPPRPSDAVDSVDVLEDDEKHLFYKPAPLKWSASGNRESSNGKVVV